MPLATSASEMWSVSSVATALHVRDGVRARSQAGRVRIAICSRVERTFAGLVARGATLEKRNVTAPLVANAAK